MENYSEFFETFEVFTIATNSLISSSLSERTDSKLCSSTYSPCRSSSSQYNVSLASFSVPLRRTCLDKTNSFRPSRYFASLTTRSAKANDLSLTVFSFIFNYQSSIINSPLSILHSASRRFLPRGPPQVNNHGIAKEGDGQPPPNSPFSIFHSPFPLSTEFCLWYFRVAVLSQVDDRGVRL